MEFEEREVSEAKAFLASFGKIALSISAFTGFKFKSAKKQTEKKTRQKMALVSTFREFNAVNPRFRLPFSQFNAAFCNLKIRALFHPLPAF